MRSRAACGASGDVLVGGSAAGTGQAGVSASSGFVVRLLENGSLDPSFGDSGVMKLAGVAPVTQVAQTTGGHDGRPRRASAAGRSGGPSAVGAFAALPGGGYLVLDPGYNLDGARPDLFDINLNTGGYISVGPLGYQVPVSLPDRGSDPDLLLAVQPDDKLLMAGIAPAANGEQAMFVTRLLGLSKPAVVELPRNKSIVEREQ